MGGLLGVRGYFDRLHKIIYSLDAAEEIGQLFPLGNLFVAAYRALPGLKWSGDRIYEQVRDNRYTLFGQRSNIYHSAYPACDSDACDRYFSTPASSEP